MSTKKNTEPTDKRGPGRPTEYRREHCEKVRALGREGKSPHQIAAALGVAKSTLLAWVARYPEFEEAMETARDLAQAWFEDVGQAGLTMPGFNASLWAKTMAARFPADYRETTRTEVTTRDLRKVTDPKQMTDDELLRLATSVAD